MNRLSEESSPYLLQHKNNPVDWFPWGEEAFNKAKKENKLVLVSVGYSACHWCHVMERECFENEEVAQLMNEHFINIKVDREERPDVDQLYMEAVQLMTQSGGWPLNCFILPDGKPFYGGTYFPKEKWMHTLSQLADLYKNDPQKINLYANNLTEKIKEGALFYEESTSPFSLETLNKGLLLWEKVFDLNNGGTLRAPKFPLPNNSIFLLRHALLSKNESLKSYVILTLKKMARGGIYDQIGGGFSRYSVDEIWKVPHFEKMLYDNAQLINLYAQAYSVTKDLELKNIVEETVEFCKRELSSDNGFFSALDADSEGIEGKYYVWSKKELKSLLGSDYKTAANYFNFNPNGLWEETYIPLRVLDDITFSKNAGISIEKLSAQINRIKKLLLTEREKRIRPGTDNKVLTSWNALLITALANASHLLEDSSFYSLAEKTASILLQRHLSSDGILYRTLRFSGPIDGFLDDYALLIEALISLYKVSGKEYWIRQAKQLTDIAIDSFFDDKTGLFFYSSNKQGELVARQVDMHDDVIPSSNSVMANNLHTLGILFSNSHYTKLSSSLLNKAITALEKNLFNYSNWGIMLQKVTYGYREVVIIGENAEKFLKQLNNTFIPNTLIVASTKESELPIFKHRYTKGETLIFVCENNTCKTPVNTVEAALNLLP